MFEFILEMQTWETLISASEYDECLTCLQALRQAQIGYIAFILSSSLMNHMAQMWFGSTNNQSSYT